MHVHYPGFMKVWSCPREDLCRTISPHRAVWLTATRRHYWRRTTNSSEPQKYICKEIVSRNARRRKRFRGEASCPFAFLHFFPCVYSKVPFLMVLMPLKFPCPVRRIVPFNFHGSNIVSLFMQIHRQIHIPPVAFFHFIMLLHAPCVVISCQARHFENS